MRSYIHMDHMLTEDLREAYVLLVQFGQEDPAFEIVETGPSPKRSVKYRSAEQSGTLFAFIVNSGQRKNYHLFYLRRPKHGDFELARKEMGAEVASENPAGEITIKVRNRSEAMAVWRVVSKTRPR